MDVKGQVVDVLTPWIRAVRLQLRERFRQDLPVLRLHSDRGGEFSFDLLWDFCRGEGILQSFTLPDSPQQNGIAEHRIGLLMEVAHTSMIHAAAPHFLWPFAVVTEFQDNPASEQHVTAVERSENETRSTGGQVGLYHPPFEKCGLPGSSLQEGASGKTSSLMVGLTHYWWP
ncbi:unnamed protein product [Closterium sp. NIES-54]